LPRALFRDNLPLTRFTFYRDLPGVDGLIRLCKNKRYGFKLSLLWNTAVSLNDFTKLVKECPHVVFEGDEVEAPKSFDIE
jgi:hypothetical protein